MPTLRLSGRDCIVDRIQVLCMKPKPYVKFGVLKKLKTMKVKVLFIAESPPKDGDDGYFYNESVEGRLTKKIFALLGIHKVSVEKGLQKFKEKFSTLLNHLLTDKSWRMNINVSG